ncbi:hypothetical protein BDQ17DRAFT_1378588 [Cyathus striatus]|nr:hypothetical protein BDQ17DRAFT_1378588 [Cyathus striatus]
MPHPYAGSAGYIYANGRMAAESDPSFRLYRSRESPPRAPPPLPEKPRINNVDRFASTRNRKETNTYKPHNRSESDLRPIRRKDIGGSELRFTSESSSGPRDTLKRVYKSMKKRFARMRDAIDTRRSRIESSRSFRSVHPFQITWPKRLIPRRRIQRLSTIFWASDQW